MRTGADRSEQGLEGISYESLGNGWAFGGQVWTGVTYYAGPLVGICWAITGQLGTCFTLGPTSGGT